jgi:TatD DNase family protein
MTIAWVDTHCHVYDDKMDSNDTVSIAQAREAGVQKMIVIGTDLDTTRSALEIASRHDDVWATVGLHPHDAKNGLDGLAELIDDPKVVGIGECGLDYYYEHSDRNAQREIFSAQIAWANERDLPLVIHTRSAWDDTFDVLDACGTPRRTIFHCFTGDVDEARKCVDRGAYLSFSGIVTFKNANDIRRAAAWCPSDRLLVETDAPFLAPVPHRGKPNTPALVPVVGAFVAEVRSIGVEECAEITTRNACLAFPGIAS